MATAAHNLLAEKYKLVKENEKEDILGGLDATADLYAKSEQYVDKILQYTAEFRDEQEKYPVYGRTVNGVYVPNNPEEFEENRQKNADYYNYIYREVSSLIRKLTKDATSRSNSVMWLLSTIRNTPLRDTDENVAIHKNYTIAFLTELFVCLLTHGKLTQSFYETKRSLEREYYGEELNESEKEDILGGLDAALAQEEKVQSYVDQILNIKKDYLSRPQNAQTKEIYQTAVYHRTSQIVKSLAHYKESAQLLTDFIVDNIWKGSRYPDKYFNDVLYLAFRYLIQEGDLNEDFYEELKGIRQAYEVH